ncbi:glycosyltransferase family 4 protein [Planococcus sp. CPCC 101016]|uniref:glycosyltransferase n=1 Tax=Planococcus sp. CPCC 101016 TaxID=2599617 RepID=UPI0011B75CF7|nr:glycosyltransferase [Planococcus sp. CPCC 101016]TWT07026.1 glycosyltransferase family 4 protein [Planococcus sp. CPCC 101016]
MITFSNDHFFEFEKPARPVKSIALIHKNMKPGGVEMLIVRMAKWLSARDYKVTLFLFSSGGPLLRQLETVKNVTIVVDEDSSDPSVNLWLVTKMLQMRLDDKFDLVYSFDPKSFLLSYLLPANKRMSGVYHPESYKKERMSSVIKTLKVIDPKFYKKLMFMNPSIKKVTEEAIGEPLNDTIFPLPLDFCPPSVNLSNFQSRRIVSIGQLAHFKTYNYYMVDIMEKLIEIDPSFTYHIYGTGQGEDTLREKIAASPSRDHIFMHGAITYEGKKNALQDTFCFVGMGVPLIEAAGCGIPAITAKINDRFGLTEGFLDQLPPYESGDSFSEHSDLFSVQSQIEKLLLNEIEYLKVSKQGRIKAHTEFESNQVMEKFIKEAEMKTAAFRLH